jgi:hypothetical protein
MDEQTTHFLTREIDGLRSEFREFKQDTKDELRDIKGIVTTIAAFKWQIIGGGVVISALLSIAVSVISAIISK